MKLISLIKIILIGLLFCPIVIYSQNNGEIKNEIIEKRVEYLIEDAEEPDIDYSTIFDQLVYYYEHPLNINRATLTDFEALGLLTSIQINNLLKHIEKKGKLISLEELQAVQGYDLGLIQLILPFVKISSDIHKRNFSFNELLKNGQNELLVRYATVLEEKEGFSRMNKSDLNKNKNSRYQGNKAQVYSRYRYKYGNNLSVGFTAEKDPGEDFFSGSQKKGFDFYSAHFFLRNKGKIKQLALGDYQAQFGQGLTYWSGISFGKSADIFGIKRNASGLKPYTSVDENRFLRGGGIMFQFDKINTTFFYSKNNIDANIILTDSLSQDKEVFSVSSIQQTGLHRTLNEIEDKDAIFQQQIGGNLSYKTRRYSFGLTGVRSQLSSDFDPSMSTHNQFGNRNNQQTNVGLDYNWIYKNVNFFGEYSKSVNAGSAFVSGALIALDPKFSVTVLYRDYQRNFQPISSAGLAESSTNQNEKGVYIGVVASPIKSLIFSAYYDQFTFPWLRFNVNGPSNGYQYLAQISYKFSSKTEMYLRIRERNKLENTSIDLEDGIDYLVSEKRTNYRYHFSYQISPSFKLKNRVELISYKKEELPYETGYLIYQDIIYKVKRSPFSFSFRYGIFDTKSFNSRIYTYENDVLHQFSIPAFFNRGTRTYLTIRYNLVKGVDLWLRYGLTYYDNIDFIGAGLEEIQGNHRQEIKAQVRFKF